MCIDRCTAKFFEVRSLHPVFCLMLPASCLLFLPPFLVICSVFTSDLLNPPGCEVGRHGSN